MADCLVPPLLLPEHSSRFQQAPLLVAFRGLCARGRPTEAPYLLLASDLPETRARSNETGHHTLATARSGVGQSAKGTRGLRADPFGAEPFRAEPFRVARCGGAAGLGQQVERPGLAQQTRPRGAGLRAVHGGAHPAGAPVEQLVLTIISPSSLPSWRESLACFPFKNECCGKPLSSHALNATEYERHL